jgi:hypothetical protein
MNETKSVLLDQAGLNRLCSGFGPVRLVRDVWVTHTVIASVHLFPPSHKTVAATALLLLATLLLTLIQEKTAVAGEASWKPFIH